MWRAAYPRLEDRRQGWSHSRPLLLPQIRLAPPWPSWRQRCSPWGQTLLPTYKTTCCGWQTDCRGKTATSQEFTEMQIAIYAKHKLLWYRPRAIASDYFDAARKTKGREDRNSNSKGRLSALDLEGFCAVSFLPKALIVFIDYRAAWKIWLWLVSKMWFTLLSSSRSEQERLLKEVVDFEGRPISLYHAIWWKQESAWNQERSTLKAEYEVMPQRAIKTGLSLTHNSYA